ncbi:hypothetical protein G6F31_020767 [Rhizopus arrhizus]|nr:hypothetical protein G6F31_020767 [Rhizopus arrhizus]
MPDDIAGLYPGVTWTSTTTLPPARTSSTAFRKTPTNSAGSETGPKPVRPCARASPARSGAGSSMRCPIHRFSIGRLRSRATRSWCNSSVKKDRLLATIISNGILALAAVQSADPPRR